MDSPFAIRIRVLVRSRRNRVTPLYVSPFGLLIWILFLFSTSTIRMARKRTYIFVSFSYEGLADNDLSRVVVKYLSMNRFGGTVMGSPCLCWQKVVSRELADWS